MSSRPTVLQVVGTRPNFMKTAPIVAELRRRSDAFEQVLVHTGQHFDDEMSTIFFDQLGVGEPDFFLDVGSGSHALMTARVMERIEPVLVDVQPDVVLVPGDVNSTLAAALVVSKLGITLGHVEAGLRSFDRTMPEEINRILTDQLSDLLFTHSPEAINHLLNEGCRGDAIHPVGNTMIDTLLVMRDRIDQLDAAAAHGLEAESYIVVTLHRPALVDGPLLLNAVRELQALAQQYTIVFPAHPRTRQRMEALGIDLSHDRLRMLPPLGYLEFLSLVGSSAAVLTDSGGIQEETTVLGVPCFTLRDNTERPVTISEGTNTLLGLRPERIADVPALITEVRARPERIPEGWDGRAAERVVDILEREFDAQRTVAAAQG